MENAAKRLLPAFRTDAESRESPVIGQKRFGRVMTSYLAGMVGYTGVATNSQVITLFNDAILMMQFTAYWYGYFKAE